MIIDFVKEVDSDTALKTLGQIATILAGEPSNEELGRAMDRAGSNYRPDPDASTWLAAVGRTMARAYNELPRVDSGDAT